MGHTVSPAHPTVAGLGVPTPHPAVPLVPLPDDAGQRFGPVRGGGASGGPPCLAGQPLRDHPQWGIRGLAGVPWRRRAPLCVGRCAPRCWLPF